MVSYRRRSVAAPTCACELTHTCARLAQIVVKGRLGLDRAADYLEELRAHSRSRAVSVALLSPSPDTDPDDLDHLERVRADMLLEAAVVSWHE